MQKASNNNKIFNGGGWWSSLRVRLVRELGGEGRGDILIKSVFGSQGEGRDFKIILLFYP